jgi:hypothetical protein
MKMSNKNIWSIKMKFFLKLDDQVFGDELAKGTQL